jgi:hypothetical protein
MVNQGILIWKGGGYAGLHQIAALIRMRHHPWTGTTDGVPRTNGVPPLNGGLEKPPSRWKRLVRWAKWMLHGGK